MISKKRKEDLLDNFMILYESFGKELLSALGLTILPLEGDALCTRIYNQSNQNVAAGIYTIDDRNDSVSLKYSLSDDNYIQFDDTGELFVHLTSPTGSLALTVNSFDTNDYTANININEENFLDEFSDLNIDTKKGQHIQIALSSNNENQWVSREFNVIKNDKRLSVCALEQDTNHLFVTTLKRDGHILLSYKPSGMPNEKSITFEVDDNTAPMIEDAIITANRNQATLAMAMQRIDSYIPNLSKTLSGLSPELKRIITAPSEDIEPSELIDTIHYMVDSSSCPSCDMVTDISASPIGKVYMIEKLFSTKKDES